MEEQRRILEQLIESGADYETIVKQSQKLDKHIVNYYKNNF